MESLGVFILGLLLLALGADSLVKGAAGLDQQFKVSGFVSALAIVFFGTSASELAVNASAVVRAHSDLAVGNAIGSNVVNIGLVLGAAALFAPLQTRLRLLGGQMLAVIVASGLLLVLSLDGQLSRIDGIVLLAGLVAVVAYMFVAARREDAGTRAALADAVATRPGLGLNLLRLLLGMGLLVYGATKTVDGSLLLAAAWGMSELLAGLTLVAIGTALPELAMALVAARMGRGDVVVGGVIGANLCNILLVLGGTAAWQPLPMALSLTRIEIPAMIAFALVLYPLMRGDCRIERYEGGILLSAFSALFAFQIWHATL